MLASPLSPLVPMRTQPPKRPKPERPLLLLLLPPPTPPFPTGARPRSFSPLISLRSSVPGNARWPRPGAPLLTRSFVVGAFPFHRRAAYAGGLGGTRFLLALLFFGSGPTAPDAAPLFVCSFSRRAAFCARHLYRSPPAASSPPFPALPPSLPPSSSAPSASPHATHCRGIARALCLESNPSIHPSHPSIHPSPPRKKNGFVIAPHFRPPTPLSLHRPQLKGTQPRHWGGARFGLPPLPSIEML